jgi:hypothetical protein
MVGKSSNWYRKENYHGRNPPFYLLGSTPNWLHISSKTVNIRKVSIFVLKNFLYRYNNSSPTRVVDTVSWWKFTGKKVRLCLTKTNAGSQKKGKWAQQFMLTVSRARERFGAICSPIIQPSFITKHNMVSEPACDQIRIHPRVKRQTLGKITFHPHSFELRSPCFQQ